MFSPDKTAFFEDMERMHLALTFDDVRMRTCSGSAAPLPDVIDVESQFSQHVELKVPFVSAAMDTVTNGDMAIAMARLGGIGVVHGAMTIGEQRNEVRRVKKDIQGRIDAPITVREDMTLERVLNMCEQKRYRFRTFPVVNHEGQFVGSLAEEDFRFPDSFTITAGEAMTHETEIACAPKGTTLEDAYHQMQEHKLPMLPLLDDHKRVKGLYLFTDVSRIFRDVGQYNVDERGQLRTAAAISTGADALERAEALSKYLDVLVIDTADGDSYYAFETLKELREALPDIDIVVGNISDGDSARELAEAGANGIKVGQGPGSICTTRRETGIGMPQVTAVYEAVKALGKDFAHIPVCADGGIKDHGDIPIAFAAGAHSVMMGRMLAGTKEAPGEVITRLDGTKVKLYRGMGSPSALQTNAASRERYGANGTVFLAEGVEAQVPYTGSVEDVLKVCLLALRKGMRYVKAPDLTTHRENTRFIRITNAGLRESHPHDVDVVKQ